MVCQVYDAIVLLKRELEENNNSIVLKNTINLNCGRNLFESKKKK